MSRRQENTTNLNPTTNLIHWKITSIFVIPDEINMSDLNSFDMNMIGKETITSLASTLIGHNMNNLEETITLLEVLKKAIETMPVCFYFIFIYFELFYFLLIYFRMVPH
jgi:hypothetical protein